MVLFFGTRTLLVALLASLVPPTLVNGEYRSEIVVRTSVRRIGLLIRARERERFVDGFSPTAVVAAIIVAHDDVCPAGSER